MSQTIIAQGATMAIKKQSVKLMIEQEKIGWWSRKMMGTAKDGDKSPYPVQILTDLEKDKGEQITFDLLMQKTQQPVEGDDVMDGKEVKLQFYTDSLYITQLRGGTNAGGEMTRKRTIHDLRDKTRATESVWWAAVFDELLFMYTSGARGVNADFNYPTTYTGLPGNPLAAPDAEHIYYAGGLAKATLTTANKASLNDIRKILAGAKMMNNIRTTAGTDGNLKTPKIQPVMVEGESRYVMVFNPWQVHDLKTDAGTNGWMDLQKAAAAAEGNKSKIFLGNLGMIDGVVLQEHENIIRFSDYGTGSNVLAARALFMGAQAAVIAWGSPGGNDKMRFKWHEEEDDRGNVLIITTSAIVGVEKVTFNGKDYGVYAYDTAATDPR